MRTWVDADACPKRKRLVGVAAGLMLFGCSAGDDATLKEIGAHLESTDSQSIDFAALAGPRWTRVCFFGPYSGGSSEVLGFQWEIKDRTSVLSSDGHNVIVFATGQEVVSFAVLPRRKADFWKLSGQCFARRDARFVKDSASAGSTNFVTPQPREQR